MNGKIEMVVFDWAGTTVDYASEAPAAVFSKVFSDEGIHFTRQEINKPMGMEKRDHIRVLLETDKGTQTWKQVHGASWNEEDVNAIYTKFEAVLADVVAAYSKPIDGVIETVDELRRAGLKIGSTTGYNADIMTRVSPAAKALGYEPDCVVTPDDTGSGRPAPFMIFECMRQMNVYPPDHVVKVGDTVVDMQEGKNAGAFSIGVLQGSNLLGLTQEEYEAMPGDELDARKSRARASYMHAGADLVIDSVQDLPKAIAALEQKL